MSVHLKLAKTQQSSSEDGLTRSDTSETFLPTRCQSHWWRKVPMCCVRFTMSSSYRKEVERQLKTAQQLGNVRPITYLLAILAVLDGQSVAQVALILRVHADRKFKRHFCASALGACPGLPSAPPAPGAPWAAPSY
jgi:hypothetical protein